MRFYDNFVDDTLCTLSLKLMNTELVDVGRPEKHMNKLAFSLMKFPKL